MAYLPDFGKKKGETEDIRQLKNYIYQLEDQIRYALSHIDGDNITQGTVGAAALAADAVTGRSIAKGAITGKQLAQDSVGADNLSTDVTHKINQMIAQAGEAQLGSGEFRQAVNTQISLATIDYTKIVRAAASILIGTSDSKIQFPLLRLTADNLGQGQLLYKAQDGAIYAMSGSTDARLLLGTENIAAGAVTAEKLGSDTGEAIAESLNAETFFAREDVKAAIKAIMAETGEENAEN